jgi:hypothetical protein
MKKLITLIALALLTVSCQELVPTRVVPTKVVPTKVEVTTTNYKAKSIEYITGILKTNDNNLGLYKVTLQDGKEVLLYNDSKGISMIQLK